MARGGPARYHAHESYIGAESTMQRETSASFGFAAPNWLEELLEQEQETLRRSPDERMALAVRLARENVAHDLGGPFGAAVFDAQGQLLGAGVNLVMAERCSLLHAEVVALMLAQRRAGRYDLSAGGQEHCSLFSSVEPCMMCQGAVLWSGVSELVCGARDEDARQAGFDEGVKPERWWRQFEQRGIAVVRDVLRERAAEVLREYVERGGVIYNAGRGQKE
jgi:tRNA(Arg) A34 adenosine deaminase TadA